MTSFSAFARHHSLARLGLFAGALLGVAALAVLAATGGRDAELVAAVVALAVAALGMSVARALESASGRLAGLVGKLECDARVSAIQVELGGTLTAVRAALHAHGAPRLVGERLYFGDHLVNGDNALVDGKRPRDGFVSLLVGDVRVATTLTDAAGARALGSRLAPGPVLALYRNGGSYFGTNEVLGRTYVTVYEPLFVDDRPVAAIAVGLPRDGALTPVPAPRNEVARIFAGLAELERSTAEKAKLEQRAFAERIRVADDARRVAARAMAAVSGQKLVVEGLTEALEKLAQNDLSHRIDAAFPSEYEALKGAFAHAAETLSDTVGALVTQGHAIFEITAQLAENADSLSQRSELQAANLQESAASLNEIASSSKRSAEGASHARDVVAAADADAARGAQVVDEAVGAMRQLSESATKISQIVGLIDEIAFQTNLLALNAGVEAARAGDAGRGFAVVAMEVRALALRSAEAAKEIRVLIGASRAGVTRGVELVTRTGEALSRIVAQVAQLNAIVADIAGGAADQAYALEEISAAINQMDETTQANTAVALRSTAAAKSLEDEAQQLNALVSQFRLPEAPVGRRRAA